MENMRYDIIRANQKHALANLAALVWHKCPYDSKPEVTACRAVETALEIQREVERQVGESVVLPSFGETDG